VLLPASVGPTSCTGGHDKWAAIDAYIETGPSNLRLYLLETGSVTLCNGQNRRVCCKGFGHTTARGPGAPVWLAYSRRMCNACGENYGASNRSLQVAMGETCCISCRPTQQCVLLAASPNIEHVVYRRDRWCLRGSARAWCVLR